MRHDYFPLSVRAMIVVGVALLVSTNGCEKVPTFQELTKQGQTTPAVPATPAETAKPAPTQQPVAPVLVAPVVEDPQKTISDFKNKPSYNRNDQDLARIGSLSSGLDAFTDMDLKGSSVTDDGLKHLAKLTNLESISLGNTKVTSAGLMAMVELPKLISMNLTACTVTLPMMETLSKLEKLEVLSLESGKIGDAELPPLVNLPRLKDLNLNYCPISDNGFKVLGMLKHLEILRVAHSPINGSGMQFMKRKKTEVGLRILDAKKTRFGEQGLQFLKGVETLEELDIGQAEVSDRTLALNLKGVTHLKKLNLGFNVLSDSGTPVLGGIRSLEELSLANTSITDKTLFVLKGNKELRILDLNGCGNISANGVKALNKFLPDLDIRFPGAKP